MEFSDCVIFSCTVLSVIALGFGCDITNCISSNGLVCNEEGDCDCGVCTCNGTYSGPTCEECPTCPSPCEIYKHCVGCKIFGTGRLGTMECIIQCDYVATFLPVDKKQFDKPTTDDEKMILCTNLNEAYCMESFRVGGMREGYRDLFVRTEEHCDKKYIPTTTQVIEIPTGTPESRYTVPDRTTESEDRKKSEDVVAVAGSDNKQRGGDNGSEAVTTPILLFTASTMIYFMM